MTAIGVSRVVLTTTICAAEGSGLPVWQAIFGFVMPPHLAQPVELLRLPSSARDQQLMRLTELKSP